MYGRSSQVETGRDPEWIDFSEDNAIADGAKISPGASGRFSQRARRSRSTVCAKKRPRNFAGVFDV
jgi:hypothetical protein